MRLSRSMTVYATPADRRLASRPLRLAAALVVLAPLLACSELSASAQARGGRPADCHVPARRFERLGGSAGSLEPRLLRSRSDHEGAGLEFHCVRL
jgi:hypothetical protein